MIKTCAWCHNHFDTYDKRRKYCSSQCALQARRHSNSQRMSATRTQDKVEWARHEAEKLLGMANECGVGCVTDYVYNNYKERK